MLGPGKNAFHSVPPRRPGAGRCLFPDRARWAGTYLCLALSLGCFLASQPLALAETGSRPFHFPNDALAYSNQLTWQYDLDPASGRMVAHKSAPRPSYTLHCFVVVRSARQFFQHARFEPNEPKASQAVYRHLVGLVLAKSPRRSSPDEQKIVIPGYSSLREFSQEHEALLKAEGGGPWQSYFQRGNWRMVFPFSRRHQRRTAERLVREVEENRAPIVHLVCFPALTLNHAVLLFGCSETALGIEFSAYDPNQPSRPVRLVYERGSGRFCLERTPYFAGGAVKVYEIYRGIFH